ncbi:hypothetical protein [Fulvivirga kasyanovii]|uniref:Thiamine diphosphokinase n=1 Tax=Fulvivirga kasyanovii TaxID=396812 RepID=A0ABW9RRI7_9BACT|nr:hypothetical protein [Fulvivirga kasyanovii]MTI26321.1 hypothetical protein [Fulvivirga kasyanovii]
MSSHHFVREDQEPALLIMGPVNQDTLFQLLEWSPKVIVVQEAVKLILDYGVKIDAIVCNRESMDELRSKLSFQMPIQFITDDTDTSHYMQALAFLMDLNCKAVHILGEVRENVMNQLTTISLDIVIWKNKYKWSYCRSGYFRKWVTKGNLFVLDAHAIVSIKSDVEVRQYEEQNKLIIEPLSDGMVAFQSSTPFWLGEHIY